MSQQVQTIRFEKAAGWTDTKAKAWLRDHDRKAPEPDETEEWLWYRQFDPGLCAADSHQTLTQNMPKGVQMVTCERPSKSVHVKALQDPEDALRFVVTDQSVDRIGDVIEVEGWDFESFKQNPVALWSHQHDAPIGAWRDLKVENGRVSARLELARPGTSPLIDSIRSLVEQRYVKAASVGFIPIDAEPIEKSSGMRFKKAELLEISLVSVPANPRALMLAKSLSPSDQRRLLVAPDIPEPHQVASPPGKPAAIPSVKVRTMTTVTGRPTLNDRVQFKRDQINGLRDQLEAIDDEVADAQAQTRMIELASEIAEAEQALQALEAKERALGAKIPESNAKMTIYRPGQPSPQLRKAAPDVGLVIKAMTAMVRSHDMRLPLDQGLEAFYPGYEDLRTFLKGHEELKVLEKAGVSPALTGVAGWAQELVRQSYGQFLELFVGNSVFPSIAANTVSFDGTGRIVYPVEALSSPDIAGSFVGESQPIPVRRGTFTSLSINPYKMGVITAWSREIANQSTPTVENIMRAMVVRRTRKAIDTTLLDNTAASPGIRPAGLQTYATGANTAASAGTSAVNILADIRGRLGQVYSLDMGERLQWIMHPNRLLGLEFVTNTQGTFQFPGIQQSKMLAGHPIITSTNVPANIVFLVDAASLVFAIAPAPELLVDNTATIHMEDTAPSQIIPGPALPPGTAAPATIGAIPTPVMSLFQTATFALRLLWDMSWGVARTGAVQTITACNW